jgi:ribose 1,5-bisphosphokinase PhnN
LIRVREENDEIRARLERGARNWDFRVGKLKPTMF